MALADPTGGAGRDVLMDTLKQLKKQYAGINNTPGPPQERPVTTWTPSDEWLKNWLAQNPAHAAAAAAGSLGGIPPRTTSTSSSGPGSDTGGPGWGDGYGTAGWDASGQNLYNPMLARGDMPMPASWGGVGKLDTYGTPFWRRDFDPNRPGYILGEN